MKNESSSRPQPIAVALVEDNRNLRQGMVQILDAAQACRCVGAYSHAEDLIEYASELKPDVVLMDIGLPQMSGIDGARILKAKHPRLEVVMLSVFEDDDNVFRAICAGASGYMTKPVLPEQLVETVELAFSGGTPMSPHIARKVLKLFKRFAPHTTADYDLTAREREVMELLVEGCDFAEIAGRLNVSVFTVRAHIRNIYEKLHVHSKSQAVAKAIREQLI